MESTAYQSDRHYSVGTDSKTCIKERIAEVHGHDSRQTRFIGELEKMLGDEKQYSQSTQKFKTYVRGHMNVPQNTDGLVDEFINSGYIAALERLRAPNSEDALDYYHNYATNHGMTLAQAVLFGPNGTAREAFKRWRRDESLRGQHRSNYRPQDEHMAKAYDNAPRNTRHLPEAKDGYGDIEQIAIADDKGKLPEGIESEIVKAFGRERQLYQSNWYKGVKRLSGDLPYRIIEAMAIELLAKQKNHESKRPNILPSKLEKIVEDANTKGKDAFAQLYDLHGNNRRALKYAWNDARRVLNNYAVKRWQQRENYSEHIAKKKEKDLPGTIYLNNGRYYWLPKKGEKPIALVPDKEKNRLPGSLMKNKPGGYFWWIPSHNFRRRMVPEGQRVATKDLKTAQTLQQQEWQRIQAQEPQLADELKSIRKWGVATRCKPTAVRIAKKLWSKMQREDPQTAARVMSDKRPEATKPDMDTVWPSWTEEKARLTHTDNEPQIPILYQQQDLRDEWEYGLRAPAGLEKTVDRIKRIDWLKKDAMLVFDDNSPRASKQIAIQSNGRDWTKQQEEQNKRYTVQGATSIDKDTGRFRIDIYKPGFNDKNVLTEEIYHIVFGIMRQARPAIYKSTQRWHNKRLNAEIDPTCTIEEAFAANMALEETGVQTSLPRSVVKYAKKVFSDKSSVDRSVVREVKANWPHHG